MELNIDEVLQRAVAVGASDVHLKVGSAPIVRIDGELRRLDGFESLRPDDTKAYAEEIFTSNAAADFKARGTADFAYGKQRTRSIPRNRIPPTWLGVDGASASCARFEDIR